MSRQKGGVMEDVREHMVEVIREVIDDRPSYFVRAIAEEIAASQADLLREWAEAMAVQSLSMYIGRMVGADRRRSLITGKAGRFGFAADAFEAGDEDALSVFRRSVCVDDDGRQKQIGELTAADHRFVAVSYRTNANDDLMKAAFHDAVAKKCGLHKKTSEAMTEEQYVRLFESITKRKGEAA